MTQEPPEMRTSSEASVSRDRKARTTARKRGGQILDRLLVGAIVIAIIMVAATLLLVIRQVSRQDAAPATAADAAVSRALASVEADPQNRYAHLMLADAYFQYGFYDDALDTLGDAESIETTSATMNAYVEIGYGRVYEAMGDSESAETHYLAALQHEESFDAHYALGEIALAKGDDDAAIEHWLKAMEYQPSAATVRVKIASVYEDRGDYVLALEQLEEAIKYIPDDEEAVTAYERVKAQVEK